MTSKNSPETGNVHVGYRIKERRKLLRINQSKLAELMGFSYQQLQKYEAGKSHISVEKLLLFSKILNVPPAYFFEGLKIEDSTIGKSPEANIIQKIRPEPLRLLLVEDNPSDAILFKSVLKKSSEKTDVYMIHDAESVMPFLKSPDKFGQKMPDLIILDLSMPKISGMELLRRIKKNNPTLGIPVVMLTNSISVKEMTESYKCGAAGFIQKSVDLKEYSELVEIAIKYWSKTVVLPYSN